MFQCLCVSDLIRYCLIFPYSSSPIALCAVGWLLESSIVILSFRLFCPSLPLALPVLFCPLFLSVLFVFQCHFYCFNFYSYLVVARTKFSLLQQSPNRTSAFSIASNLSNLWIYKFVPCLASDSQPLLAVLSAYFRIFHCFVEFETSLRFFAANL